MSKSVLLPLSFLVAALSCSNSSGISAPSLLAATSLAPTPSLHVADDVEGNDDGDEDDEELPAYVTAALHHHNSCDNYYGILIFQRKVKDFQRSVHQFMEHQQTYCNDEATKFRQPSSLGRALIEQYHQSPELFRDPQNIRNAARNSDPVTRVWLLHQIGEDATPYLDDLAGLSVQARHDLGLNPTPQFYLAQGDELIKIHNFDQAYNAYQLAGVLGKERIKDLLKMYITLPVSHGL